MKKTVVLGVSSGIAAYKILDLVKMLREEELDVVVILSPSATKMVDTREFEQASGNKVYTDLFEKGFDYKKVLKSRKVDHINVADSADVFVIAPATANTLAKIANGYGNNFLTTTALAISSPVIICPSMNVNMWNNPAVQENVKKIKTLGYQIIYPESGMLACGYEGTGRLANLDTIKEAVLEQLAFSSSLKNKKILVTSGGTTEPIDDVRFLSNKSSGKMGAAIADECYLRGAEVFLLRSRTAVEPRYHIHSETFETSDELSGLVREKVKDFDIVFHTAAVSDFEVETTNGKIPSDGEHTIKLKPRKKIIDQIKKWNSRIFLVAFKAESKISEIELAREGRTLLTRTGSDAVVANDVGRPDRGFGSDNNEVIIILKNGQTKKIELRSKREVAKNILDFLDL